MKFMRIFILKFTTKAEAVCAASVNMLMLWSYFAYTRTRTYTHGCIYSTSHCMIDRLMDGYATYWLYVYIYTSWGSYYIQSLWKVGGR